MPITQTALDTAAQHAGELSPAVIATISGASGALARMVATAMPSNPRSGLISAMTISSVSLWIWAWSTYSWSRQGAFGLFVGWVVITVATYGILQGSDPGKVSGTLNTLSGGRMGTPKE